MFSGKVLTKYLDEFLEKEYQNLGLWFSLSFIFGIVLYFSLPYEPTTYFLFVAGLIIVLFSFLIYKLKIVSLTLNSLILVIVFFLLGIAVGKIRFLLSVPSEISQKVTAGIEGVVSNVKVGRKLQLLVRDVKLYKSDKHAQYPKRKLLIKLYASAEQAKRVKVGNRIYLYALLDSPYKNNVPDSYKYNLRTYFQGIDAVGYSLSRVKIKKSIKRRNIQDTLENYRYKIYSNLIQILGEEHGNFISAILLGDGYGLSPKIVEYTRNAGISHLLCISGLHLSLASMTFFIFTRFLLNLFPSIAFNLNTKIFASAASLFGSLGYLLLSGIQIAATRAFIMIATVTLSVLCNRGFIPLRLVSLAAMVILTIHPEYVLHPSFQLSFIAVIALISGYKLYFKFQKRTNNFFTKILCFFVSNIYSSLLASLATAPIVMYHFHSHSNYTILANLVAVPIMSFWIMPLTLISLPMMLIGFEKIILQIVGYGVYATIKLAEMITNLPSSIIKTGYLDSYVLFTYLLGFFWLICWETSVRFLGLLVILIAIAWHFLTPRPFLLLDIENEVFMLNNSKNILEIHAPKMSRFAKQYWMNWFGKKDVIFLKSMKPIRYHIFFTNSGKQITLRSQLSDPCPKNSLILNMTKDEKCIGSYLNNIKELSLVLCNKKKCWLSTLPKNRFNFT